MDFKTFISSPFTWIACLVILLGLGAVIYILHKQRQTKIEKYSNTKQTLTIVYIFSKTCPHCVKFEPTFDSTLKTFIEQTRDFNVRVIKQEHTKLEDQYKNYVDGLPTVLLYKEDTLYKKTTGNQTSKDLMTFLTT